MSEALKQFLLNQANTSNQGRAHQMQQFYHEVERLEARAKLFESPEFGALAMQLAGGNERVAKAYYFNPVALFEDARK